MILRAILFDLDDTIITEGERLPILVQVAEEMADSLAPHSPAVVAHALEIAFQSFWSTPARARLARLGAASGIRQARETIVADTFRSLGVITGAWLAPAFCERFAELRSLRSRMFDGARETLIAFRQQGVRVALVTNGASEIQRAKLERFGLAPLFDHVQIEGEHGFGKPEERAYLYAMQTLGVVASQTWMVGDNLEWEVAAPQRLGIHAIWHDHRGKGLPANAGVVPDRVVRRLSELLVPVRRKGPASIAMPDSGRD